MSIISAIIGWLRPAPAPAPSGGPFVNVKVVPGPVQPGTDVPHIKPGHPPGDPRAERVLRTYQTFGWPVRLPGMANITYLEGRAKDFTRNGNRENAFDDLRMVWTLDTDGTPHIIGGPWWATTEPSVFWKRNRLNPRGAFHIAGGWQACWVRGWYHGARALVQHTDIKGTRDDNEDGKRFGDIADQGQFGVHHHGSFGATHDDMGRSSAGCQVGCEGHEAFMDIIDADPSEVANPGRFKWSSAVIQPDMLED